MRNRVKKALYALSDTEKSRILDTKKLKGVNGRENLFRLRIGNYRVVYFEDVKSFKIIQIIHRGPWDKIHLTLQSMNDSNHYYVILISFNIPFIFRC